MTIDKKIFCIVGKSGSGKSYYMEAISSDIKFMKKANLSTLVYGTTRDRREGEVNGKDYNFVTIDEYNKIPKSKLIESRTYATINGKKYYFTKDEYIEKPNTNLICTSSLYQYESYRNWINLKNLDISKSKNILGSYSLFLIIIEADVRNRLERIINNRCKSETDIYEACRRIVEERSEFSDVESRIPEFQDPLSYPNVIIVNNDDIGLENTVKNIDKIKNFILSK